MSGSQGDDPPSNRDRWDAIVDYGRASPPSRPSEGDGFPAPTPEEPGAHPPADEETTSHPSHPDEPSAADSHPSAEPPAAGEASGAPPHRDEPPSTPSLERRRSSGRRRSAALFDKLFGQAEPGGDEIGTEPTAKGPEPAMSTSDSGALAESEAGSHPSHLAPRARSRRNSRRAAPFIVAAALVAVLILVVVALVVRNDDNSTVASAASTTTTAATAGGAGQAAGQCSPWPTLANSEPSALAAGGPGYYLWDDFGGWHVRFIAGSTPNRFKGTVTASAKMQSVAKVPATAEGMVELVANRLTFDLAGSAQPAGFDLVIGCASNSVRFDLQDSAASWPVETIYLGRDGRAVTNPLLVERVR